MKFELNIELKNEKFIYDDHCNLWSNFVCDTKDTNMTLKKEKKPVCIKNDFST